MYLAVQYLHFVSLLSTDSSLWCKIFSNSDVMKAVHKNHRISKKIFLECLCHGFEPSLCEMDECVVDVPVLFVIFVNVDSLSFELANKEMKNAIAMGEKI